jgi:hypothetical protein
MPVGVFNLSLVEKALAAWLPVNRNAVPHDSIRPSATFPGNGAL